ncbi:MAG: hypothetical protein AMJ43_01720 [Coxiella sp. DG_40]|nr:MAG: hypothetical protein AMJ43_01720 [Coxiella sp. DG_40]
MNRYLKYGLSTVVVAFSLGITTVVLASGFYAPAAPAEGPYFNGPYLGIGAGIVHAHVDANEEGSGEVTVEETTHYNFDKSHNFDMGKCGFNGNVFVGYGKTFESSPSYYLGGEMFGNYLSPTLKGSSYSYTNPTGDGQKIMSMYTEVKNPYSFGGDIRGGYLVNPKTMVYALFGLDYAQFKVKSGFGYQYIDMAIDRHVAHDFSKWKLGYMPGVGIETGLTAHVSLRAQYTYTFYSSFSKNVLNGDDQQPQKEYKEKLVTKVKPSTGLFTVKLSYLFN